jgi:RNase H-fold protein (predicted Holliday junction resolvase)
LEGDVRRAERKEKRDQLAATILLQSYLDAHSDL